MLDKLCIIFLKDIEQQKVICIRYIIRKFII